MRFPLVPKLEIGKRTVSPLSAFLIETAGLGGQVAGRLPPIRKRYQSARMDTYCFKGHPADEFKKLSARRAQSLDTFAISCAFRVVRLRFGIADWNKTIFAARYC